MQHHFPILPLSLQPCSLSTTIYITLTFSFRTALTERRCVSPMDASFYKIPQHSSATSYGVSGKGAAASATTDMVDPEQFPVGLRVLVVDDDVTTLKILERMSVRCHYRVTTCDGAAAALNLLRERKDCFDVVLSDVHMPEMDGYKLLEHVGMEMDLPVIMMSVDGTTSAVMKGISHGACDYLIKPVRDEELKNIWQHVVRKMWNGNKEHENSGSLEDNNQNKQENDDAEYISVDAAKGIVKTKKRSSLNEEEVELDVDDPSKSKKPRVVWSVELHNQFVSAVNQLRLDKAVPKRILELMNVTGLTRENVASHLQKFRLYLRRFSGVVQQQNGMPNTGLGTKESRLGAPGGFDVQALAAAGHVFPEAVAALQAEPLGHPTTNIITTVDEASLLQASIQGPKGSHAEQAVAYGQPLVNCPPNFAKNFPQSILTVDDTLSGNGAWPPSNKIDSVGPNTSVGRAGVQSNNMLMDILQHQPRQPQQMPLMRDQSRSINVQPSCLVAPSGSSGPFHVVVNSPASVNLDYSFGRNAFINHGRFSQQSNNSMSISHFPGVNTKSRDVLSGFTTASIAQLLSCSINSINSNIQQVQNSTLAFGNVRPLPGLLPMSDRQALLGTQSGLGNLGFVDSSTLIPNRFAANQIESSVSNFSQMKVSVDINGSTLNEEPNSINDPAVSHQVLQR